MKFAKKVLSIVLSSIIFMSSITGTVSVLADTSFLPPSEPVYEGISEGITTVKPNVKIDNKYAVSKNDIESGKIDANTNFKNQIDETTLSNYYSFTPTKTGIYSISVKSAPVYVGYNLALYNKYLSKKYFTKADAAEASKTYSNSHEGLYEDTTFSKPLTKDSNKDLVTVENVEDKDAFLSSQTNVKAELYEFREIHSWKYDNNSAKVIPDKETVFTDSYAEHLNLKDDYLIANKTYYFKVTVKSFLDTQEVRNNKGEKYVNVVKTSANPHAQLSIDLVSNNEAKYIIDYHTSDKTQTNYSEDIKPQKVNVPANYIGSGYDEPQYNGEHAVVSKENNYIPYVERHISVPFCTAEYYGCFDSNATTAIVKNTFNDIKVTSFTNYSNNIQTLVLGTNIKSLQGLNKTTAPNLKDVYYSGTKEQWDKIDKTGNDALEQASIHFESDYSDEIIKGTCGKNLTYTFNKTTGVMTISGTGDMYDYTNTNENSTAPWQAFKNKITSILIEDGVTSIGNNAFSYSDAKSISIPDSVTIIGDKAFLHCSITGTFTIPKNINKIGTNAFLYCDNISEFKVDSANQNYCSTENGVLFNKSKTTLIQAPALISTKTYVIPNGVKSISEGAFTNCKNILQFQFPESLNQINMRAFSGSGIENITLPNNINIDTNALFENCTNLTSVKLPNNLTAINSYAFNNCQKLTTIYIPKSVTSIYNNAFKGCENLTDVNYDGYQDQWDKINLGTFLEDAPNANINVIVHKHDYKAIVTKPTCTEKGYTTYICSQCGDSYKTDYIDKIEHSIVIDEAKEATCTSTGLTEGSHCSICNVVIKAQTIIPKTEHQFEISENSATCTKEGYIIYTCKNCGELKANRTNALGHNYITEIIAPTCLQKGYTNHICSRCGDTFKDNFTEKTEHKFGDYVFDNNATCSADGTKTAICTLCGSHSTITAEGTKTPHDLRFVQDTATCTQSGYLISNCKNCDYISKVFSPKKDHTYILESNTATCQHEGECTFKCSVCNDTYKQPSPKTDHNYYEWNITKQPSCQNYGLAVRSCRNCGATDSKHLDKVAHSQISVEEIAPTCQKTGLTAGTICKVCGEVINGRQPIAKISHNYILDEVASRPATCTETGMNYYKCTMCGNSYETVTSIKSHNYELIEHNDSTPNKRGYDMFKCASCNDTYTEWLPYASDNSVLVAAIMMASLFNKADFSQASFEDFKKIYDSCKALANKNSSQEEIDAAITNIINAMTNLVPYADINVFSKACNPTVTYNGESSEETYHSVLYGTEIKVTAPKVDGYVFTCWYDTKSKRIVSEESDYIFYASTNLTLEAIYSTVQSATLTFANQSGQITQQIEKNTEEWNNVDNLASLLPEVPYSYGYTNGRWDYNNDEVLAKLRNGGNVTITPIYDKEDDKDKFNKPDNNSEYEPTATLSFKYNNAYMKGSFIMDTNIPKGCRINSIGIAFYYGNKKMFDPTQMVLTLNNKREVSNFSALIIENRYIVNTTTNGHNWAAVGYITYLNQNNELVTYYTNQVNVINNEWIK